MNNLNTTCQICGKNFYFLGSHITHAHNMTTRDYKSKFNLDYNFTLMDKNLVEKKQKIFALNRKKYLKNLETKKYQFKKGEINRKRFSKQSLERAKKQLDVINSKREKLICPFCETKFLNLNVHLMMKHNLIISTWSKNEKQKNKDRKLLIRFIRKFDSLIKKERNNLCVEVPNFMRPDYKKSEDADILMPYSWNVVYLEVINDTKFSRALLAEWERRSLKWD